MQDKSAADYWAVLRVAASFNIRFTAVCRIAYWPAGQERS